MVSVESMPGQFSALHAHTNGIHATDNGSHDVNLHPLLSDGTALPPSFQDVADFTAPTIEAAPEAPAEAAKAEGSAVKPNKKPSALYFVRVPKPNIDESKVKGLKEKVEAKKEKLRGFNGKLQEKRAEAAGLRSELALARQLMDDARPENDERGMRFAEMRKLRDNLQAQIASLKEDLKGLDARSEVELQQKIRAQEERIQYDGLSLREEKQVVQAISKLNAQRERVRACEGSAAQLKDLEAELSKVRSAMSESSGEVQVLRGERQQARSILDELKAKVGVVMEELRELEAGRAVVEKERDAAQAELRAAHESIDGQMREYYDNRRFSTRVRDMVAEGRVAEAQELCAAQSAEAMAKLNSDAAHRKAYYKLWESQRKYVVSDLLPNSGNPQPRPGDVAAAAAATAASRPVAPRPVPQGKEKAAALIQGLLQETDREMQATRKTAPADVEDADHAPSAVARAGAPSAPSSAPAALPSARAAAKPSQRPEVQYAKQLLELPKVQAYDDGFVPPLASKSAEPALSPEEEKERVRELNRIKAAEAEARKKKRTESAIKKRQQLEERAREQKRDAAQQADSEKTAAVAPPAAEAAADDDAAGAAAAAEPVLAAADPERPAAAARSGAGPKSAAGGGRARAGPGPVARRPKVKKPVASVATAKDLLKQYQMQIMIAVIASILVLLLAWGLSS